MKIPEFIKFLSEKYINIILISSHTDYYGVGQIGIILDSTDDEQFDRDVWAASKDIGAHVRYCVIQRDLNIESMQHSVKACGGSNFKVLYQRSENE